MRTFEKKKDFGLLFLIYSYYSTSHYLCKNSVHIMLQYNFCGTSVTVLVEVVVFNGDPPDYNFWYIMSYVTLPLEVVIFYWYPTATFQCTELLFLFEWFLLTFANVLMSHNLRELLFSLDFCFWFTFHFLEALLFSV